MGIALFIFLMAAWAFLCAAIAFTVFSRNYQKQHPNKKKLIILLWVGCGISVLFLAGSLKMAVETLEAMIDIFG